MKFETKCKKLGITEEVEKIIDNCELYEGHQRIVELSKLRKWEIQEEIGNYFEWIDKDGNEVFSLDLRTMKKFLDIFGIEENEVAEYYALGISEGAGEIAYAINDDVILILE